MSHTRRVQWPNLRHTRDQFQVGDVESGAVEVVGTGDTPESLARRFVAAEEVVVLDEASVIRSAMLVFQAAVLVYLKGTTSRQYVVSPRAYEHLRWLWLLLDVDHPTIGSVTWGELDQPLAFYRTQHTPMGGGDPTAGGGPATGAASTAGGGAATGAAPTAGGGAATGAAPTGSKDGGGGAAPATGGVEFGTPTDDLDSKPEPKLPNILSESQPKWTAFLTGLPYETQYNGLRSAFHRFATRTRLLLIPTRRVIVRSGSD